MASVTKRLLTRQKYCDRFSNMENISVNYNNLLSRIQDKPFVLYLGAGINPNFCPKWDKLIENLLTHAINHILADKNQTSNSKKAIIKYLTNSTNIYYKGAVIKTILGDEYINAIQDEVYKNYNEQKIKEAYDSWCGIKNDVKAGKITINQIDKKIKNYLYTILCAELCSERNIVAVLTTNYDNYLTYIINLIGKRKAYNVFQSKHENPMDDRLPIFNFHGYFSPPNDFRKMTEHNIVLSQDEYFQIMFEPYSWQTSTQLHFLMNYTCLILGASLDDWNMQRMFSFAKKYSKNDNFYILTTDLYSKIAGDDYGLNYEDKEFTNSVLSRIRSSVYSGLGINTIDCGRSFDNIYKKVFEIINIINESNKKNGENDL